MMPKWFEEKKVIRCEWCGKTALLTDEEGIFDYRSIEVFGVDHTICYDCYERLE
jgi:hypothetical protein